MAWRSNSLGVDVRQGEGLPFIPGSWLFDSSYDGIYKTTPEIFDPGRTVHPEAGATTYANCIGDPGKLEFLTEQQRPVISLVQKCPIFAATVTSQICALFIFT